jgi:hypothetical protein
MDETKIGGCKEGKRSYNSLTEQCSSRPGAATVKLCSFSLCTPCLTLPVLKRALNRPAARMSRSRAYSLRLILSGGLVFSTGA